ncbi:hypothetical protein B0H13DRAFT_2338081 [Mycena leptocephala]|nr:hypothetical protein B0H13DRAFT_2338081 [Mycena leptocephala]
MDTNPKKNKVPQMASRCGHERGVSDCVVEQRGNIVYAWFVKGKCRFGQKCSRVHVLSSQAIAAERNNKKADHGAPWIPKNGALNKISQLAPARPLQDIKPFNALEGTAQLLVGYVRTQSPPLTGGILKDLGPLYSRPSSSLPYPTRLPPPRTRAMLEGYDEIGRKNQGGNRNRIFDEPGKEDVDLDPADLIPCCLADLLTPEERRRRMSKVNLE